MLTRRLRFWLAKLVHLRLAVILHDLFMVWAGWLASRALSVTGTQGLEIPLKALFLPEMPMIILIQGTVFWFTGLYRGLWRFASLPDLWNLVKGALIGSVLVWLALWLSQSTFLVSNPKLLIMYPVALVIFLGAPRVLFRSWKDATRNERMRNLSRRTLVLGAGSSGAVLLRELQRHGQYRVLGLLDDNPALHNARVHGVKVLGGIGLLPRLADEMGIQLAIIALPAATNQQMQRVVGFCEQAAIEFKTIPGLHELSEPDMQPVEQVSQLDNLKDVALEDLLGRAPVNLDWQSLRTGFTGKQVLITGGGGSIGSELAHLIASLEPARLVIIDHSEFNLYRIELELGEQFPQLQCHYLLGDITDAPMLTSAFADYQPEIILHTAAYKHLPMLQQQLRAAMRNNVLGTRAVVDAAHACDSVESFVLISTDKAVNPSNVMGASKRIAELYCHAQNGTGKIRFVTVRFGNVLNSTGSVVPRFKQQIKRGGPVTVTHPDMNRYFMTLREAGSLILQAAMLGKGGEIFVLDMGEQISIRFLAEQLIKLHGKQPDKDIDIVYTGLRPGEKLNEELFHAGETLQATSHPKIMLASARRADRQLLDAQLNIAAEAIAAHDQAKLLQSLHNALAITGDTMSGHTEATDE